MTMLPALPTASFPYRILAKIGEGAMGEVYRAEDIELGRLVAIKVVKADFIASLSQRDAHDALQRFLQEARAAAALSHPGVTTVHRVGTEGGWPYIAMEWLEGNTLEDVLASQKSMTLELATRLGLQVLAVLDVAHRAGIVHRDIKPANLMVTANRRIKVTDFGVARVQGSNLAHTQVGLVLGTPQYAAPEQLAGKAVDARADLYALGAVLYEAILGRPPFEAESLYELISLVQTATPPAPSSLLPVLPESLDAFFVRALAKNPSARFSSAAEMARALQPFLNSAAPPGSLVPSRKVAGLEPTLMQVPTLCVDGSTASALVANTARQWPATALGGQNLHGLIQRLLEKPLHARAFCGALDAMGTWLLICDGIIFAAFNPELGSSGDSAIESLPNEVEATIYSCPEGIEARVVTLLASLTSPGDSRLSALDAAYVDVPQLAAKLAAEGFDGAVRLARGSSLGFILFSRGKRVLDVFSRGWSPEPTARRWEYWLSGSGAVASVEDRRTQFPSVTFRHQLRDTALEVVRARPSSPASIRSDTRAEAEALELRPKQLGKQEIWAESTLSALVESDPAVSTARWVLVDLAPQFEQFRRTKRWRALLEPLDAVDAVKLHHSIHLGNGHSATFDATTFGPGGLLYHVIDRVAQGTKKAVDDFIARVTATKFASGPSRTLVGAILVAPSFTEEALEAYLSALSDSRGALKAALNVFSHREGVLSVGSDGCHVLLVEEQSGRRRPLVPE